MKKQYCRKTISISDEADKIIGEKCINLSKYVDKKIKEEFVNEKK